VFGLYNTLLHMALLVSLPLWPFVLFSRRRFYRGFLERLGRYPTSTKASLAGGQPIWIHAASVGEVKSAAPLIDEIKAAFPEQKILLSTMTVTGREFAKKSVAGTDAVVYFPLDVPWVVANTLRQLDPSLVVLLETEVWPNFIHASHRRGVPVVMLSGRVSARSERRYQRFGGVFVRVLREISAFGMQDRVDADRLLRLGVAPSKVLITGSLKRAESAWPKTPAALDTVTGYQSRPVVVVGSTHRGEEEIFIESLTELHAEFPDVLLIIAPRHPERFDEVETLLRRGRHRYRKRSEAGPVDLEGYQVLLVDSLGELPWIYGWADVVFVGGTLVNVGGHNLIEPGRWGKPILLGPHTANVAEVAKAMIDGGGAIQVRTKDELVHQLARLLANKERAVDMGRRAQVMATSDRRVLSDTMAMVRRVLQPGAPPTRVNAH
jgi:3-deoxy-D-manno-octulosonic-acid transferase